MIRIQLTRSEYAHFSDLTLKCAAVFRDKDHDSPAGQRELRIKALESVIGNDHPRARIGDKLFEVYGGRGENTERWQ